MFKLSITKRAEKDIVRLERQMKNRVITALQDCLTNRVPQVASKSKVKKVFREFGSVIGVSRT